MALHAGRTETALARTKANNDFVVDRCFVRRPLLRLSTSKPKAILRNIEGLLNGEAPPHGHRLGAARKGSLSCLVPGQPRLFTGPPSPEHGPMPARGEGHHFSTTAKSA